jgi:adenine-specific DNA-methyltransferase
VDIDPSAIEITKLRLWLSLVVDEEDRRSIRPLPNLDYKIMQGNSLLSEFMGIDFDKENGDQDVQLSILQDDVDTLTGDLKNKKDEYLNVTNANKKKKLKQEIEELVIEIFETRLKKQKAHYFRMMEAIENKYKGLPSKEQKEALIQVDKEKFHKSSGFNLEQFENQLREYTTRNKIWFFFFW